MTESITHFQLAAIADPEEQEPPSPIKLRDRLSSTQSGSSEDSFDLIFNIQNVLTSDKHIKSLHNKEKSSRLAPDFLNLASINSKMRTRLVKWLITLNQDLEFKIDTLFLAVSILDHYLAVSAETAKSLQLIGATCLYISSKLLETKLISPEVYAFSASGVFTSLDLLDSEKKILLALNFKIDFPDALRFLKLLRNYEGVQEKDFSQCVQVLTFVAQYDTLYYEYSGLELAQLTIRLAKTCSSVLGGELDAERLRKEFRSFRV